jgi:hypothetical protein
MRVVFSFILLTAALATLVSLPSSAAAKAPAYSGYCGKQAKKNKGIVRSQLESAGIFEYSRKDHTRGFWCFEKYKTWDHSPAGKISFPAPPVYVPGKCFALPTFSSYSASQVDLHVIPTKRTKGHWNLGSQNVTTFGPPGPGPPGGFNPHHDKAVKSPVYKLELLDNCVAVLAFRAGGKTGAGRIQLFEARDKWVPWYETPLPSSGMSDQELRSVTAAPAGDHMISLSWTELGIPYNEIYADKGVKSSF